MGSDIFPSILTQLLPSDNLHTKPTPWGTSHLLSPAQHPAELNHNLLEIDVLKQKAVISGKLLVQYENFLSSVWITEMLQWSIQVLNYSVFSEKMKRRFLCFRPPRSCVKEQDPSYSKEFNLHYVLIAHCSKEHVGYWIWKQTTNLSFIKSSNFAEGHS